MACSATASYAKSALACQRRCGSFTRFRTGQSDPCVLVAAEDEAKRSGGHDRQTQMALGARADWHAVDRRVGPRRRSHAVADRLRRSQRNHGAALGRHRKRAVPQIRCRSARAANSQWTDHDGDFGLRRHTAGVGGTEQCTQYDGKRFETWVLRRRQQPRAARSDRPQRHRDFGGFAWQKFRRAKHRRRLLDLDHGRARCAGHRSGKIQTQHARHRRHRHGHPSADHRQRRRHGRTV